MKKFLLYITLLGILPVTVKSQEYLSGLYTNPQVQKEYQKTKLKSGQNIQDTLELPFIDDFSAPGFSPDKYKWADNHVYINTMFSNNPPTLGVATFDIIDQQGYLHENASKTRFGADTLTSLPIDLGPEYQVNIQGTLYKNIEIEQIKCFDTATSNYLALESLYSRNTSGKLQTAFEKTIFTTPDSLFLFHQNQDEYFHYNDTFFYKPPDSSNYLAFPRAALGRDPLTLNDSVVFSFFWQAGGLGDMPEDTDSLKVQFFSPENKRWYSYPEFRIPGDTTKDFHTFKFLIEKEMFLQKGFRFRIINLGTLSANTSDPGRTSNADVWNIDYVYLDKNRDIDQDWFPDVAHVTPLNSILKTYESMPWDHFIGSNALYTETDPTIFFKTRNLYNTDKAPDRNLVFRKAGNDTILSAEYGTLNIINAQELFEGSESFIAPFQQDFSLDYAHYEISSYLTLIDTLQLIKQNDTVKYIQTFRNYYAYDDGTAENGYGLSGSGTFGGKVATSFNLYLSDTLKAVQVYFNKSLDSANYQGFNLAIWSDTAIGVESRPNKIIYKFPDQFPHYDGLNMVHEYKVPDDTLVILSGNIWVGMVQQTDEFLNIGFDLNRNSNDKIKFNIDGEWEQTKFSGSLMIRPVFGKILPLNLDKKEQKIPEQEIHLYPNPADDVLFIDLPGQDMAEVNISVYTITGQVIHQQQGINREIITSGWKPGIYVIRVTNRETFNISKPIIISR